MQKSTRSMPLFEPEDLIHDVYVVDRYISKGGFAQVWKVTTSHSYMPYAMKVLHPSHRKEEEGRFHLERDILRGLNELHNPRTPRVHWSGKASHPRREQEELDFIVMDFVKGLTLGEVLQRGKDGIKDICGLHFEKGRLTYTSFLALMDQILEGLADVHKLGFVHRDIKPSNILFVEGSSLNVKLIDFGIAKQFSMVTGHMDFLKDNGAYQHMTRTGTFVLSSHYAAPEQIFEASSCDPRTDLFAVGLIAYQCLVGQPYYPSHMDQEEVLSQILHTLQDPITLPEDVVEIAPRVAELIHSMLTKKITHRLSIFQNEEGDLLYDLQKDGSSLTRLVRQHFHTLGRDTQSHQDVVMVPPSPSSIPDTEEQDRTLKLREQKHIIQQHGAVPVEDLHTQDVSFDVERYARQEFEETKSIRAGLYDPLEDKKTIPLNAVPDEDIQDRTYRAEKLEAIPPVSGASERLDESKLFNHNERSPEPEYLRENHTSPVITTSEVRDMDEEDKYDASPKKSSKGLLLGLVVMVLGGLLVWQMLSPSEQKTSSVMDDQISALEKQEASPKEDPPVKEEHSSEKIDLSVQSAMEKAHQVAMDGHAQALSASQKKQIPEKKVIKKVAREKKPSQKPKTTTTPEPTKTTTTLDFNNWGVN